ncbi:MAG TPA: hypothetical protein DEA22_10940 [Blastocatellia bacterium]|nr:hypothetical protein [Blastocatellia bacterium]
MLIVKIRKDTAMTEMRNRIDIGLPIAKKISTNGGFKQCKQAGWREVSPAPLLPAAAASGAYFPMLQ